MRMVIYTVVRSNLEFSEESHVAIFSAKTLAFFLFFFLNKPNYENDYDLFIHSFKYSTNQTASRSHSLY